jgi:CubicO group peptidase (beta-lactamase class C family)
MHYQKNTHSLWIIGLSVASLLLGACGGGGSDNDSVGLVATPVAAAPAPLDLGTRETLLFWTPEQQRVGYRNMELVYSTRAISRIANNPRPVFDLPSAPVNLSNLRYQYQGVSYSLADFVANNRVAGLLVLKNGQVAYEQYAYGHTRESKWTSFSVAKSVVSLLVGAAIRDGDIASINDPVTMYLPQLQGSAYEGVTVRHLLQMSSGVTWNEDYGDTQSDVGRIGAVMRDSGTNGLLQYMSALPRAATPGVRFNYSTGETHLVGALLEAAVRDNISNYLSRKIWSTFAMESDAFWMLASANGPEMGGCCLSATLRDYGRIGLYALRNGTLGDGSQSLPTGWMSASTTASPTNAGYGHLWWLTGNGTYGAFGVFGQSIQIVPQQNVVVVMQSFWPTSGGSVLSGHRTAVTNAILATVM